MKKAFWITTICITATAAVLCPRGAFAQSQYTVTDLGMPAGAYNVTPYSVNASGQVAGTAAYPGFASRAFLGPPLADLGTLGGTNSDANSLNERGEVVGGASAANEYYRAFIYRGGKMLNITKKNGSVAFGVNNAVNPQVVGTITSSIGRGGRQAFSWQNGVQTLLAFLPNGRYAEARAVNNSGLIVGWSSTTSNDNHRAALWNGITAAPRDLGFGDGSTAVAVNGAGQVVGTYTVAGNIRGFLWQNGSAVDLGTLGGPQTQPRAINSAGVIVGVTDTPSGSVPFRWQNGVLTDLRTLAATGNTIELNTAVGINDAGQIGCTGYYRDADGNPTGNQHAFLLTPNP